MGTVVGVDLGTTKCVVAVGAPGETSRVLRNEFGDAETPSVVARDRHGQIIVGKQAAFRHDNRAIMSAKRQFGQNSAGATSDSELVRAEEAVACLLRSLKETAERELGEAVDGAVIGIPHHWTSEAREKLREVAAEAGFDTVQFLSEPVAAAIAALEGDTERSRRVLTYDWGGGKFESAVLGIHDGNIEVLGCTGDQTGGCDLDVHLVAWMREQLRSRGYELPERREHSDDDNIDARLIREAESVKRILSQESTCRVHVAGLGQDLTGRLIELDACIERSQFEQMISEDVGRTFALSQQMLDSAGLTIHDIDDVLLLGGCTKMPVVRQRMESWFGREPGWADPLHSVALGAAQCASRVQVAVPPSQPDRVVAEPEPHSDRQAHVATMVEGTLPDSGADDASRQAMSTLQSRLEWGRRFLSQYAAILSTSERQRITESIAAAQCVVEEQLAPRANDASEVLVRQLMTCGAASLIEQSRWAVEIAEPDAQQRLIRAADQLRHAVESGNKNQANKFSDALSSLLRQAYERQQHSERAERAHSLGGLLGGSGRPERPMKRETGSVGVRGGSPELPAATTDCVHFSVTSPTSVRPGVSFILDVWAHLQQQRVQVLERAQQVYGGREVLMQSKGPVSVARGTVLTVRLQIEGFEVPDPEDTILWDGEIGNARFRVAVPPDVTAGDCDGVAGIYADGLRIAKLYFAIPVGKQSAPTGVVPSRQERVQRAFVSYAHEDMDAVLGRLQGMQKRSPSLELFLDVLTLRSGQNWEDALYHEIANSDVFYLFWSNSARDSEWVDREWRCALSRRGIEFIDPVPLVDPRVVPPPPELSQKHFNDWVLAFLGRPLASR